MKSFEKWLYEEVEETFGIVHQPKHPLLLQWLENDEIATENETTTLNILQALLQESVDDWNEAELKANFIIPLFFTVNYTAQYYKSFWERHLQAKINDIKLYGIVDFMVASGKQTPHQPYFCLHEYKPSQGNRNDPRGQLLCAMVCAQAKNSNIHQPIYGVYVIGRLWYFVILVDKIYSVSLPFDVSQEGLFKVFRALKYIRTILNNLLAKPDIANSK